MKKHEKLFAKNLIIPSKKLCKDVNYTQKMRMNLCLISIRAPKPQSIHTRESERDDFHFRIAHACRISQSNFPQFLSPKARFGDFLRSSSCRWELIPFTFLPRSRLQKRKEKFSERSEN